jgi:hypothetical protein
MRAQGISSGEPQACCPHSPHLLHEQRGAIDIDNA